MVVVGLALAAVSAALLVWLDDDRHDVRRGSVAGISTISGTNDAAASVLLTARDPWLRPFASTSIWNMPIGSAARYVPAQLRPARHGVGLDRALLVRTRATDPRRAVLQPGHWRHRCSGRVPTGLTVNVPDSFVVPDARTDAEGGWITPNNVAAFLQPDGRTLVNVNAVARCDPSGPVFGYATGSRSLDVTDLYGDGILGAHGASRLSALGGAIRKGELSDAAPIRHALDVIVSSTYLSYGTAKGYRWPARGADAYASPETYTGTVPDLRMGSLLAVPPSVTPEQLGLTSHVARKVFAALRDYGGYVTDDAGWDYHYLTVDTAAVGTFPWTRTEQAEVNRVFGALSVVANNAPTTVGGGGRPRRPLLPALTR